MLVTDLEQVGELVSVVDLAVGVPRLPCQVFSAISAKKWDTTRGIAQKMQRALEGGMEGDQPRGELPPLGATLPPTGQTGREPDLMGSLIKTMGRHRGRAPKSQRVEWGTE